MTKKKKKKKSQHYKYGIPTSRSMGINWDCSRYIKTINTYSPKSNLSDFLFLHRYVNLYVQDEYEKNRGCKCSNGDFYWTLGKLE